MPTTLLKELMLSSGYSTYLPRASIAEQVVPEKGGPGLGVGQLALEVAALALGRAHRLHRHDAGTLVHGAVGYLQVNYALGKRN